MREDHSHLKLVPALRPTENLPAPGGFGDLPPGFRDLTPEEERQLRRRVRRLHSVDTEDV